MNRSRHILLIFLLLCGSAFSVRAEKYLTISEAQTLCFPTATTFEEKNVRFTAAEKKAIEKRLGTKVQNAGSPLWIAKANGKVVGVLILDRVIGKHLYIDYVLALSTEGTVQQVEILEYRESHGGQIRGAKWRDQFKGKNSSSQLALNKDIYNISGATLSCRHVTEGIKRLLATYEMVVAPQLVGADGLQKQSSTDR